MPFDSLISRQFYEACDMATFYALTFGWSFRCCGRNKLPCSGPALLISNHQSFLDPILVGSASGRRLTYLARSNLWNHRAMGKLISLYGAVPIDRNFGREGLHTVLELLEQGAIVLMFPEGERTHTGEVQPLKPGISLLVKRVKCPIIPVGIAGAYQAWPRQQKAPSLEPLLGKSRGNALAVSIGSPLYPEAIADFNREQMLTELFERIQREFHVAQRLRRAT